MRRTNSSRSLQPPSFRVPLSVAVVLAAAGCGDDSGASPCTRPSDCPAGLVCVDGTCRAVPDGGDGDADVPPPDGDGDVPGPDADADGDTPGPDADADADADDGGPPITEVSCEVLVVGGGLGGVAAAHEAASAGADTCLVDSLDWLGGQITSQGTSALDEGFDEFSSTYADLRQRIWQAYRDGYDIDPGVDWTGTRSYNPPGTCWVSKLCFEPLVALDILENDILGPLVAPAGVRGLHVWKPWTPIAVDRSGVVVTGVLFEDPAGLRMRITADVTIDATELGDLFPLAGVDYRVGGESQAATGEPDAPVGGAPECVQPFTYTFALELRPAGEEHTIPPPADYDPAPFSLQGWMFFQSRPDSEWFDTTYGFPYSFWTYRRLLAAPNFRAGAVNDLAMINWGGNPGGNDFNNGCGTDGCNPIDRSPEVAARIFERGRQHALKFVYWLQHDVPRDDGTGYGYPNLLLRADVMGTADGISKYPYIREARRLEAVTMITENDAASINQTAEPEWTRSSYRAATRFADSIGIARYGFDLHPCAGGPAYPISLSMGAAQIPYGALIPRTVDGLLAAAKNIGVTKLANGGYRLQPSEWNIGQAAGAAAALAVELGIQPRGIRDDETLLRRLQHRLVTGRGGPIYWWNDPRSSLIAAGEGLLRSDAAWVAAQMVAVEGVLIGDDLPAFRPAGTLTRGQAAAVVSRLFDIPAVTDCAPTFTDVPCTHSLYGAVEAIARRGITSGCGGGLYCVDDPVTRAQLAVFLVRAACDPSWDESRCPLTRPGMPSYSDLPATDLFWAYVETARARGWLAGDADGSTFDPAGSLTRRSAALWAWNVLRLRWGL